ncbi:hypothetical protein GCM10025858_29610 [Alicyclobacillus sacchari]|nr:hypothetical protein GCM10025858_29610 [Alicyclobacillus sacchari]
MLCVTCRVKLFMQYINGGPLYGSPVWLYVVRMVLRLLFFANEVAQNRLQNTAVAVVFDFDIAVETDVRLKCEGRTVFALYFDVDRRTWLQVVAETKDAKRFAAR